MSGSLTPKQRAFIVEYVRHGNATKAARLAGYSPKWAAEAGYKLVQKSTVLKAIEELQGEIEEQLDYSSWKTHYKHEKH
jgi:phage terminase small subunit